MKLIFSMPGVPSATPAHENSASTGPPHSSTAASIEAVSARFTWMAFAPASVDLGAKSITTTSAPASCTSSAAARTHAGGTTDDEHALAVVAERIEKAHVSSSWRDWMVVHVRRRRRGP